MTPSTNGYRTDGDKACRKRRFASVTAKPLHRAVKFHYLLEILMKIMGKRLPPTRVRVW